MDDDDHACGHHPSMVTIIHLSAASKRLMGRGPFSSIADPHVYVSPVLQVRATCIALFLFCMNQVGGNLPVIITPLKDQLDYRSALAIVWPGFTALSAFLFFLSSFPLCYMQRAIQRRSATEEQRRHNTESQESEEKSPGEEPTEPLIT